MSWIKEVMLGIDRLGNAIAGGNSLATISGRTGYFARKPSNPFYAYWKFLELSINLAFEPIDGRNHCEKTYFKERHLQHNHGSDLFRAVLGILVIFNCFFIAILTRVYVLLIPSARYKETA